jgi:hypothetical protein
VKEKRKKNGKVVGAPFEKDTPELKEDESILLLSYFPNLKTLDFLESRHFKQTCLMA